MIQVRDPRFLNLTIYLIVAIMVIISCITMPDALTQAASIALCAAFGLVHAFGFRKADTPGRLAIYLIAQTMIILILLRLASPKDFFNLFFYILALEAVMILPIRPAIAWIAGFYVLDSLNALWDQGTGGIIGVLFYAAAFILTAVFGYHFARLKSPAARTRNCLKS